jgi:hypothetical protein
LEEAVAITDPHSNKHVSDSESNRKREAAWIVRWAIRAVAAEIIRTGKITLPLKVRFVSEYQDKDEDNADWWRRGSEGDDYSLN